MTENGKAQRRLEPNECSCKPYHCFFCQRESVDDLLDNQNLHATKLWWMGEKIATLICERCIAFMGADPTTLKKPCDFCGYPSKLSDYTWFNERLEGSSRPPHHSAAFGYRCCKQCKEFFARNPLTENP